MGITASEIYLLNHMNTTADLTQLGTLIRNAENVVAANVSLAEDMVFIGNSAGVAEQAKLPVQKVGKMDVDFEVDRVSSVGYSQTALPTGTAGDVNGLTCSKGDFEWSVLGTQTKVAMGWEVGVGLKFVQDEADNDGAEITQGITAASNPTSKVAGTDNFRFTCKWIVDDVTGSDFLTVGLRKIEAYQGALATYTDYAGVKLDITDLVLATDLNDGGTADVDSTMDAVNAENVEVRITIGDEARLQTGMLLANDLKAKWNTHQADATEHTAGVSAAVTAADATTTATLIVLVNALTDSYVPHDADANLASGWAYHIADGGGDALASILHVSTLAGCVTQLNDLLGSMNDHIDDTTAHTDGDTTNSTRIEASSTYFEIGLNDAALAEATVSTPFNFDTGDVVVPFFFYLQASAAQLGFAGSAIKSWKVEDTITATS